MVLVAVVGEERAFPVTNAPLTVIPGGWIFCSLVNHPVKKRQKVVQTLIKSKMKMNLLTRGRK